MKNKKPPGPLDMRKKREFSFNPRIVNPVKIEKTVIFSADEQIRNSTTGLREKMPWIDVLLYSNPLKVSGYISDKATAFLLDDTAISLVDTAKIRKNNKDSVIILLTSNEYIQRSHPSAAEEAFPFTSKADFVFAVNQKELTPDKIVSAAIRAGEDFINIHKYSKVRRYIFLIIDDEPRWFSQFLPVLYNIIGQRADVRITRTYEETLEFLFGVKQKKDIDPQKYLDQGYGDDVVCVITDVFFQKGNDLSSEAGKEIIDLIHKYYPRIRIIIASKAKEAVDLNHSAFLLPKGDPGSLLTLSSYIHDYTGMGEFLILDEDGKELYRIKNIQELYALLEFTYKNSKEAEKLRNLLEEYGRKDYFSTWLYMHSFRELGDKLRPKHDKGHRMITVLKRNILYEILRMENTPLIINGNKIYNLSDLYKLLKSIDPKKIQPLTDNDVFSSWLDRKGYTELAEELRPIHGSGEKLVRSLASRVRKWIKLYQKQGFEKSNNRVVFKP